MAKKRRHGQARDAYTIAIPVDWDAGNAILTIPQGTTSAQWGDRIFFEIHGLGAAWAPILLLPEETAGAGLIRWSQRTSSGLLVKLARRKQLKRPVGDRLRYTLAVHRGLGAGGRWPATVSRSAEATLALSRRPEIQRIRVVHVGGGIDVEPQLVSLEPGTVVEWDFSDPQLPAGSPTVIFKRFSGEGTPRNSALGPFTALMADRTRVVGSGNNGIAGSYFFSVMLIDRATQGVLWESSTDPVVDNMGEPDDPGSG